MLGSVKEVLGKQRSSHLLDALDAYGHRIVVPRLDSLVEHGGVIDIVGKGHVIVVLPLLMNF